MAQRRHHYEVAFEHYLRTHRVPYVAVDEAKKALLPDEGRLRLVAPAEGSASGGNGHGRGPAVLSIKSFDFVLYGREANILAEVKGRRIMPRRHGSSARRLESWVTMEDVLALRAWERLFGGGFTPAFVFVYWCDEQPASALFEEIFDFRGRWYAIRAVEVEAYAESMRQRSPRWGTVDLPPAEFDRLSRTLCRALQPSPQAVASSE